MPDPVGATPRKQGLPLKSLPGAKRVKMRYGPYSVPNIRARSVTGEQGSLWNYPDLTPEKPCKECTVLRVVAGLEYPNGTNANFDTGVWLHHLNLMTVGPTRWDPTCLGDTDSFPNFAVNASTYQSERFFYSGNERTPAELTHIPNILNTTTRVMSDGPYSNVTTGRTKAGYYLRPEDQFRLIVDLINMNHNDRLVYVTLTFDYLDGPLPAGWQDIKPVWLDVDNCGSSEVRPPVETGKFVLSSRPWTPNVEGEVVGTIGGITDGAAGLRVFATGPGSGKYESAACTPQARYSEREEYVHRTRRNEITGGMRWAADHVSSLTPCWYPGIGERRMDRSQRWTVQALYDYGQYPGNKDPDGEQLDVMGLAMVYVAVPPAGVKAPAPVRRRLTRRSI
ncbi:hypothetical protein EJ06DRAFT_554535 [Trichodelitschia bisporula]|uniref:Uncharacterized protein n=1 Tax=Trichodelitschia bisporula TaxID=703511 RepID=A0A6G1I4J7_9PEZI|nr:hypothetical protein EJ06DRAFT_554535 [Trichodelitschia bisporula]